MNSVQFKFQNISGTARTKFIELSSFTTLDRGKPSSQALVTAEAVDTLGEVLGYDAKRLQGLRRHRYRRSVVGAGCGGRRRRLPGAGTARAGKGDLLSEASNPLRDLGQNLGMCIQICLLLSIWRNLLDCKTSPRYLGTKLRSSNGPRQVS